MCGLYSFRRAPEETRSLFAYLEHPNFPPRMYVTPASPIAIVREGMIDAVQGRHFALVRWGFVPSWAKEMQSRPLINARSETILEKPSFRNAIRRRRCLIPADGFYEWEGDVPGKKRPYHIHRPDHSLFGFAGVWEHWLAPDGSELESAAIITTEPNAEIARIHDRSPVVIPPDQYARWLDQTNEDAESLVDLLRPPPDGFFELTPTVIQRNTPPKKPTAPQPPPKPQMDLF